MALRRVARRQRQQRLGPPELNDDNAIGAAVLVGGSPSRYRRLRRHAPIVLPPDPVFEAVVDKRRACSISRLGTTEGAVLARIIVFGVAIVGLVVVVEREGQRYGGMRVSQLQVVEKGKRRTLGFVCFLQLTT